VEHSYAATDNASSLLTAVMGPKTALMVVMKLVSYMLFSGMPTVQVTMHTHTYTMQLCTIQSVVRITTITLCTWNSHTCNAYRL